MYILEWLMLHFTPEDLFLLLQLLTVVLVSIVAVRMATRAFLRSQLAEQRAALETLLSQELSRAVDRVVTQLGLQTPKQFLDAIQPLEQRLQTQLQGMEQKSAGELHLLRESNKGAIDKLSDVTEARLIQFQGLIKGELETFAKKLGELTESLNKQVSDLRTSSDDAHARNRTESQTTLKGFGETLTNQATNQQALLKQEFEAFARNLGTLTETLNKQVSDLRTSSDKAHADNRTESQATLKGFGDSLSLQAKGQQELLKQEFETFRSSLAGLTDSLNKQIEELRKSSDESHSKNRNESQTTLRGFGETLAKQATDQQALLKQEFETFRTGLATLTDGTRKSLEEMRKGNEDALKVNRDEMTGALNSMKKTVDDRLEVLQQNNEKKLDQIRGTVEEKLQNTLEQRLGESFKQVSERLEQVHKGLGEMQSLAHGVGDLKKVLTNVKTRGILGEVQLEAILTEILTPDQYEKNVATVPKSTERVEFAVKLPGKDEGRDHIWLPIDSKFPMEDYQRLLLAYEHASPDEVEVAAKAVETRLKADAKGIRDKYLHDGTTTHFAVLFLPTEGLYAEILRRPGLAETIRRDFRVVVAGPTTLAALLNSLRMGFQTLALQKQSGEIAQTLRTVKAEFDKFGGLLEKAEKHLQTASNTIGDVRRKSGTLTRKLRNVEQLSPGIAPAALPGLEENEPSQEPDDTDE